MKRKTLGLLFFICSMVSISGVLYNIATLWQGLVIIPNFFSDGEDMHLGTLLIFIGLIAGGVLFGISKWIKIEYNWSKEIQDVYDEQHSKRTLPKGFDKPNNGSDA